METCQLRRMFSEMTKDDRFDDETVEPEVIIRLPRGSDPVPELVPRATPRHPGAVCAEADTPDPRQHRRVGPLNDAKPKQPMFETPTLLIPGHDRPPPRAGTQPVTDPANPGALQAPAPACYLAQQLRKWKPCFTSTCFRECRRVSCKGM